MRRTPPLIVGGGPAGTAAGLMLARAGHAPLLLERTATDADALCGGFLSWRSLATLAALGVDPGVGQRVTRLRLYAGARLTERDLPAPALGVSRLRLDAVMRAALAGAGGRIERGAAARRWDAGVLHLADGAHLSCPDLFLATGKHDLRGLARPHPAGDDPMIGLRVRLAATAATRRLIGDAIELHLFDGGYAGIVMQEDSANLCLAIHRSSLAAAGGVEPLLARLAALPRLGERLAWRVPGPANAVANVPYGWRARDTRPGVWRLGDQAGVITSLAGEGMGIALATGIAAARAWAAGDTPHRYQSAAARRLRRPLAIAAMTGRAGMTPATAPLLLMAARIPGAAALIARATRIPAGPAD